MNSEQRPKGDNVALSAGLDDWRSMDSYCGEWPIRIRAPELVDEFNERGETDAVAELGDEWVAAQWCNCQDYFKTITIKPTHWQPILSSNSSATCRCPATTTPAPRSR